MEGYITNNSGKNKHIFKRRFPVGHRILLEDIWGMYKTKVCASLEKEEEDISEEEFVKWLELNKYLVKGFEVIYVAEGSLQDVLSSSDASTGPDLGKPADGRLNRPPLGKAKQGVIDNLTYKDIANLQIKDGLKEVVSRISNLSKLRRAYTTVRNMPRSRKLERVLKERIGELERIH